MKFARFFGIFLMLCITELQAQNKSTLLLNDNLEQLAMEGVEVDWQNQLEDLQFISDNPINLKDSWSSSLSYPIFR